MKDTFEIEIIEVNREEDWVYIAKYGLYDRETYPRECTNYSLPVAIVDYLLGKKLPSGRYDFIPITVIRGSLQREQFKRKKEREMYE